ncbi:MAG: SIR2 family protein [Dysgonamonadaceae bacterium]|jgi:NAD-dependent SIR2 family protein deacetylase|nr:SIR2 family protein [Dysgonamonadaceae bacterium]
MADNRKYILLQNNYSVAYTETKCFVNDEEQRKKDDNNVLSEEDVKKMAEDYKQKLYNTFLKKHYKHIVVLTAAGTSLDNGDKDKCGKTREGLWAECETEINAFKDKIADLENKSFYQDKDIEGLLSHIVLYEKLNGVITNDNDEDLKGFLETKISQSCKLDLQPQAPHKDFLNKITARKNNDARVQLFTTNYDTLFEQAANKAGFVIIDGFSFTQPREFAGKWFDLDIVNREKTRLKQEESFVSKVFHLYKLHGSLNWTKENDKIIQKNTDKPLIIYPASEKYESSYEQPYFEMMSRFQQALRKEETLLIVVGFGFQDKHIQNVIVEAVEQNPSFQLLIVNYNGTGGISTDNLDSFFVDKEQMKVKRNVNIVFNTFKDFTNNYPENQTYYSKGNENQAV